MEAQFEARKQELLAECEIASQVFEQVIPRLERFMGPFVARLVRQEQIDHALTMVQGLLSDLDEKNTESIAYRFGQERMPLQWFVGVSDWDDSVLRDELVRQVGEKLGEPDGVIVFDPSGFPSRDDNRWDGAAMVRTAGQSRQWPSRRLHGLCLESRTDVRRHAAVSSPEVTKDRARCEKAGIPEEIRYRTRHQLCLEMLQRHGPSCHTTGLRAMTKWAVPTGFAGVWTRSMSANCLRGV